MDANKGVEYPSGRRLLARPTFLIGKGLLLRT
jgi:hypothetical protein